MRRRLVKQGKSTLTVTIPSQLVKKFSMRPGDEVDIGAEGGRIEISVGSVAPLKKVKVNASKLGWIAGRSLRYLYQDFDELELVYEEPETIRFIQAVMPELLGYEIMDQKRNSCLIKNISTGESIDFATILRRTFLLIISMGEDAFEGLKSGNAQLLNGLMQKDVDVNRFCYFCLRHIKKSRYIEKEDFLGLYTTLVILEHIGDEYKLMASYLASGKVEPTKELLAALASVNAFFRSYYELFYKAKKEAMIASDAAYNKANEKIGSLMKTKGVEEIRILAYLNAISRAIYHLEGFQIERLSDLFVK